MPISFTDNVIDLRDLADWAEDLSYDLLNGGFDNIGDSSEAHNQLVSVAREFGDLAGETIHFDTLGEWLRDRADRVGDVCLVRTDYMYAYAQELFLDTVDPETAKLVREDTWPFGCIDWQCAGEKLAQDYGVVTLDGTDYYAYTSC